jgi:hypothetical protein
MVNLHIRFDQLLWVKLEEFCSYEGQEMQIKEKIAALKI